jgi:integrase
MKEQGRTFNAEQLRRAFLLKKKAAARRLSNPRLKEVTFITFRHWFGTMEYHRTKDILHMQRLLGQKSIQNTLIYIDLEAKIFNSPNEEASLPG